MPLRTAIPRLKNNQIFRANGNLTSTFLVISPATTQTNRRKLSLPTNNTLDGVFNSSQLLQGNSAGSSDQISFFDTNTNTFVNFFYRLNFGWRLSSNRTGPDQAGVVIPNNTETVIQCFPTKTITLKGQAKLVTHQTSGLGLSI